MSVAAGRGEMGQPWRMQGTGQHSWEEGACSCRWLKAWDKVLAPGS